MDLLKELVVAFLYFSRTTFNPARGADGKAAALMGFREMNLPGKEEHLFWAEIQAFVGQGEKT